MKARITVYLSVVLLIATTGSDGSLQPGTKRFPDQQPIARQAEERLRPAGQESKRAVRERCGHPVRHRRQRCGAGRGFALRRRRSGREAGDQ